MKKIIFVVSLLTVATVVAADSTVVVRGRASRAYHRVCDKMGNHKGKVGLAVGSLGATIIGKAFRKEIDAYIKPCIKSLWGKVKGWFKRVFRTKNDV